MARRRLQKSGDLYKQGGFWKLRWREDVLDDEGKLQRHWSKPVWIGPSEGVRKLTQKEASRLAWENFLSKLDQNNAVPQSVATVANFVERKFTPEHVAMLKKAGREHYAWVLKLVLPALGEMRLRDVQLDDVQRFISGLLRNRYSVQTAKHAKSVISTIFKHAEARNWVIGNPARGVRLPEMTRRERHALTFIQLHALLAELKSPARELVRCSVLTSMNVAEMRGLQWRHLNLTSEWATIDGESLPPGCLAVRQQIYMGEIGTLKRSSRRRNIPLPKTLLAMFLAMQARDQFTAPTDWVFCSRNGTPIDDHNIANRHLKPAGRRIGLPWVSWHCFRHTHTTLADQLHMTSGDRVAMMGHSNIRMTTQYTHVDLERRRDVLEQMSDKIDDPLLTAVIQ